MCALLLFGSSPYHVSFHDPSSGTDFTRLLRRYVNIMHYPREKGCLVTWFLSYNWFIFWACAQLVHSPPWFVRWVSSWLIRHQIFQVFERLHPRSAIWRRSNSCHVAGFFPTPVTWRCLFSLVDFDKEGMTHETFLFSGHCFSNYFLIVFINCFWYRMLSIYSNT